MRKLFFVLISLVFWSGQAIAQEKLYLRNQKAPIDCQITEINTSEVKYKPSDAEQLTVGVSINDVEKIVFKSGRVQSFGDPMQDFSFYKGQKKWIAKFGLLSPASGFTDFYIEKSVKPGRSIEFQANVIGLGKNSVINGQFDTSGKEFFYNQKGGSVGVGLKVLRLPDFELANRKLMHILQGGYLKPAVMLGYYQRNMVYTDPNTYTTMSRSKGVFTSLISMTVGKQWILDNTFSIDIYALVGLGVDNFRRQQSKAIREASNGLNIDNYNDIIPYKNFGYTRFGRGDAGVAVGAGVKIGYLFNVKKKKDSSGINKMRERLNK
jgi:hypothetical protein